ncbi:MAG: MarR family transcriptional regulator, partial [Polyangiaceae bacterium]|nr:MarR family transcriptional regulator [Polyangiaceae bacterium]
MSETDHVLIALRRIIRATDQNSKRLSRSSGLTIPQSVLMRAIAAHPGATLKYLTDVVSLSQATVTTIVDRLEERGLVLRRRSTEDRRATNVVLTEAGEALLRESPPPLQQEFRERFAKLADAQQALLVRALDTIATMMDARDLDASPILTLGQIQEPTRAPLPTASLPGTAATLREPESTDGPALHALVRICPPLDQNSLYCNLLQCTHFSATSIVAMQGGRLVGSVTGYVPPTAPDTL